MAQGSLETACIVSDMSDMVVVDLHSAVKAKEADEGLKGEGRNLMGITQGLWKAFSFIQILKYLTFLNIT